MIRKNILFLHLESISRTNLWQYRGELGTVWRLMSESYRFNRFYTNSTSTFMSRNDLFWGDTSIKDHCSGFSQSKNTVNEPYVYSHLINDIRKQAPDYVWMHFYSWPYKDEKETHTEWHENINCHNTTELCAKALKALSNAKKAGRPFCGYFWDGSSHLAYMSKYKNKASGVPGRLRTAYSLIDESLNEILSGIAKLGLWENTIIIGFGDHGDDPWGHGMHRGYSHALTPYGGQCWTPMFIYHPLVLGKGETDRLACMSDLKRTALGLLFPESEKHARNSDFEGIDVFREERDLVFSQNMFALQKELDDPEKGMIKGYGVTDGTYRLVVTSDAAGEELCGLEFFNDKRDPSNSHNLLLNPKISQEMSKIYARLREALKMHVRAKEEHALLKRAEILCEPPEQRAQRLLDWYMHPRSKAMVWSAKEQERRKQIWIRKFREYAGNAEKNDPCLFQEHAFHTIRGA